jgi:hypothetical protein
MNLIRMSSNYYGYNFIADLNTLVFNRDTMGDSQTASRRYARLPAMRDYFLDTARDNIYNPRSG